MNNIKVSVIIPCFNSSLTIEKSLNSIINQNFNNFEIIIVDNNSTDNTTTTSTTTSGGYKYTFTPSSKGKVSVTRTATAETLAQVIQNATGASSFSITTNPYTTNEDLGSLAGTGRNFTINGNGNTIDGTNPDGGNFNGITAESSTRKSSSNTKFKTNRNTECKTT